MADSRADELIRRADRLKAERSTYEAHWQEIADLVRPMRGDFTSRRTPGEKRTRNLYDGTALIASENFAAGLWGSITNSAATWFSLRSPDDAVNEDSAAQGWLDAVGKRMRSEFSRNGQRFYSQAFEVYADLSAFGTGIHYADEDVARGAIHFQCMNLAECLIAENQRGEVDSLIRCFTWTARQAVQMWKAKAPKVCRDAIEKEPDREFEFLHVVMPREDLDPRRKDARGKPFASLYLSREDRAVLSEGGYEEFPYQVPRWGRASRGPYGDSPAMLALPDTKMLQAMTRTTLLGAQKVVDPPLLVPDERSVRGVRTTPGGIIYGGVNAEGRPMYQPLQTGGRVDFGMEMENQRREAIKEAFYWSLLMMAGSPNRTATEVLAQQEERMRLMGPHLGRVQSEFLDPLINRVFGLMYRAGAFPPPPEILLKSPEIKVEYVGPLAKAQKTTEATAIIRALETVLPLGQVKPEALDLVNFDESVRGVFDGFGVPSKMLYDDKIVKALRDQRSQQIAAQQAMQALPVVAGAAKALTQGGPGLQAMGESMKMLAGGAPVPEGEEAA